MLIMNPAAQPTLPGQAPPGAIQPGTPGGGGLPTDTSIPTLAQSLALVPLGLQAVSVFPPWVTPRTFPATGVIFSEGPVVPRKKRWISSLADTRKGHRHALSTGEESFISRIGRGLRRFFKKLGNNIRCLGPRLTRKFGRKASSATHFSGYYGRKKRDQYEIEEVDSYDDCFDDISEPLYGWRVKVTLIDDEPCEEGISCINTEVLTQVYPSERQTGEGFRSAAPVDCRTINVCG